MTKAEKVQTKKEGFIKDVIHHIYQATDFKHGVVKGQSFIDACIKKKPQEKTFYIDCFEEAKKRVKT